MSTLTFPTGIVGVNTFLPAAWPTTDSGSSMGRVADVGSISDDFGWEGERRLLVVSPVREWLERTTVPVMQQSLREWRDLVLASAADASSGSVRICFSAHEPRGQADLLVLASGGRVVPDEAPTVEAVPAVAAFCDALRQQVDDGVAATTESAIADAAAALLRGLDNAVAADAEDAAARRRVTREVLADLERSGAEITGPRDVLLWPLPLDQGRLPVDVAVEAVLDVLRGAVEREPELDPAAQQTRVLAGEVAELRRELQGRQQAGRDLSAIPGRQLIRMLGRLR